MATIIVNDLHLEIDAIVYDFDGVLTDNRVLLSEDGRESVFVNRSDGLAISCINKLGIKQIIISTERNNVVRHRAAKLGIECINNACDKRAVLMNFCADNSYRLKNVIYIGNDINDRDAMLIVGLPACPKDAHPDIKKISVLEFAANGGYGVARELLDYISETNRGA